MKMGYIECKRRYRTVPYSDESWLLYSQSIRGELSSTGRAAWVQEVSALRPLPFYWMEVEDRIRKNIVASVDSDDDE